MRDLVADRGADTGTGDAAAVVCAIAALGASLGLTTTESVETLEQQRVVRAEGCTNMQGFLVSRPVPAGEVAGVIGALSGGKNGKPASRSATRSHTVPTSENNASILAALGG